MERDLRGEEWEGEGGRKAITREVCWLGCLSFIHFVIA